MELVIISLLIAAFLLAIHIINLKHKKSQNELQDKCNKHLEKIADLVAEVESLAKFNDIRDTTIELERVKADIERRLNDAERKITAQRAQSIKDAEEIRSKARQEAEQLTRTAQIETDTLRRETSADAKSKRERAAEILNEANIQASAIIKKAEEGAEQIAGDAYKALKEADRLKSVIDALKNSVKGYGNDYVKPTYGLLDELAEMYSFQDAGQELKRARERTKLLVSSGRAAACDYVEANRSQTAINFVIDAFNGKVDSILARGKTDNYGKLEAEIKDAYALVNQNGGAFRNARITEEYLAARIDELHWATAVHAIREAEKEEQRQIREQIREEEKARREFERAIKDSAKEEAAIQKAMERMRTQLEKATEEQKAEFELKLTELQERLAEAEAKNQRALSMAQQTKTGHVYVISNIGSFGENVYKVGMTRRLEPLDRVKELGDASVPFPFDVHAMIWSEDAPALERDLHRYFLKAQMNKVNPRKEFFKLSIEEIKSHVEGLGHKSSWTIVAAAAQFRETLKIEKLIETDPITAQEWTRHQLEYEPQLDEDSGAQDD